MTCGNESRKNATDIVCGWKSITYLLLWMPIYFGIFSISFNQFIWYIGYWERLCSSSDVYHASKIVWGCARINIQHITFNYIIWKLNGTTGCFWRSWKRPFKNSSGYLPHSWSDSICWPFECCLRMRERINYDLMHGNNHSNQYTKLIFLISDRKIPYTH